MFFTSLITPIILLVLYITFLGNVFRDTFQSALPASMTFSEKLIDGLVGGELISSILAVSCITVTFCSNFLMVQDKANGIVKDWNISPVSASALALSYYFANLICSLMICIAALGICLIYVAVVGWYMSVADVFLLLGDVVLLVLFGSALSSVINFFLSTQGQISAVGTVISSGYGFISGAYMPLSSFGEGLQTVLSFLPGTYGTSLVRNHAMRGAFEEMQSMGVPEEAVTQLKTSLDCNLNFFDHAVEEPAMYGILISAIVLLLAVYILLNRVRQHRSQKHRGQSAPV